MPATTWIQRNSPSLTSFQCMPQRLLGSTSARMLRQPAETTITSGRAPRASVPRRIGRQVGEGGVGRAARAQDAAPERVRLGVEDEPLARGAHDPRAFLQFALELPRAPPRVTDDELRRRALRRLR